MRWAVIISIFYFILLVVLVFPLYILILGEGFTEILNSYQEFLFWIIAITISTGQFLLLFLKVKELPKNRKPKARIWFTASLIGLFVLALAVTLTFSAIELFELEIFDELEFYQFCFILGSVWGFWMIYFYFFHRNDQLDDYFNHGFSFLLKGSVFELLVCIPAHIIVRQRGDCCAGYLTGVGLACGISIMLLCFGPVVLALIYKRVQLKRN